MASTQIGTGDHRIVVREPSTSAVLRRRHAQGFGNMPPEQDMPCSGLKADQEIVCHPVFYGEVIGITRVTAAKDKPPTLMRCDQFLPNFPDSADRHASSSVRFAFFQARPLCMFKPDLGVLG